MLYNLLLFAIGEGATFTLYPLLFWIIIATSIKRLHDQGYSGYWLFAVLIPVLGPLWLIWRLGFRKGNYLANKYGSVPGSAPDYLKNDEGKEIAHLKTDERIIDDVTRLNPVLVSKVVRPVSVDELCDIVKSTTGAISVGGGRFSMGGQTASPHSVHIDMRGMNKVLEFSAENKLIKCKQVFVGAAFNNTLMGTTSVSRSCKHMPISPLAAL